jgi:predicted membrane protein
VYIDPSANVTLQVRSSVGNIAMDTDANAKVTLNRINFETTTGNIDVNLSKDTVVSGSVSLQTTTGSVQFTMNETDVSGDISVNLQSTTGAVNADLTATQMLSGNVTVNARSTTGSVNLNLTIDSNIGARIESDTNVGKITVDVTRFSGNKSPIQSNNYPAGSNFLVNLTSNTGGINIHAAYGSASVLN